MRRGGSGVAVLLMFIMRAATGTVLAGNELNPSQCRLSAAGGGGGGDAAFTRKALCSNT